MQVKKFEARTMKEALEMVKKQLGPEAIILGARDNRKSYGLVGQGSVEITAAVSDEVLHRKKYTESKMREDEVQKFQASPAKVQKQIVDKFVNKYLDESKVKPAPTRTRYIEIDDSQDSSEVNSMTTAGAFQSDFDAQERIKSAAQRAWNVMQATGTPVAEAPAPMPKREARPDNTEVLALRSELAGLKATLAQFQKVPQTIVSRHPGADFGLNYEMSASFEKLTKAGISAEIAADILGQAQAQMPPVRFKNKALVDAWTARFILDSTQIVQDYKTQAKVQIFVGPPGAGKTTSMVKLAAHAAVHDQKKVALLTADSSKVGAVDQMRIYAQILNVPFAVVRKQSDWTYLMNQLANYDLILCDFPGVNLKSVEEISQVRELLPMDSAKTCVHLVLSAASKNEDLIELGRRLKVTNFQDVIFTGLDQSNQHGCIYNFMKTFSVPLHSFGTGPRVPEDFEFGTRERVLDLIFKLTKMKKQEVDL